jgi:hypothetical protein
MELGSGDEAGVYMVPRWCRCGGSDVSVGIAKYARPPVFWANQRAAIVATEARE